MLLFTLPRFRAGVQSAHSLTVVSGRGEAQDSQIYLIQGHKVPITGRTKENVIPINARGSEWAKGLPQGHSKSLGPFF